MKYTESNLSDAIEAGIFSAPAVEQFRNMVAARHDGGPGAEPEQFRLLTGYSDVFATIACLCILTSLPVLITGDEDAVTLPANVITLFAGWGMAELFVRRKHYALTGILLVCTLFISFTAIVFSLSPETDASAMLKHMRASGLHGWQMLLIGAGALPLGWALWRRFRVPVTAAAASLTAALCVLAYANDFLLSGEKWILWWLMFVLGLCVFTGAMCLDRRDRARTSVISDVAFWMHLLAAPLITHPVFVWLDVFGSQETHSLVLVAVFFLSMIGVSVLIDRRGLIVSSLFYVLFVFTMFLETRMPLALHHFSLVTLLVGVLLLLLSVFWDGCRRLVLGFCPPALRASFS